MEKPIQRIITKNDYYRIEDFRSSLLQKFNFVSLQDEDFQIKRCFSRGSRQQRQVNYYYETQSNKSCFQGSDKFTIIIRHGCNCYNSILKGWDFKPEQEQSEDENSKFGQITRRFPNCLDYGRVNCWRERILQLCGLKQYPYSHMFNIHRAYEQLVNGTRYYYQLSLQGSSDCKRFRVIIFQPFSTDWRRPSWVKYGWEGFEPEVNDMGNIVGKRPRLADKGLVQLLKTQINKACRTHYPDYSNFLIEKVYEQDKIGEDRIFYQAQAEGSGDPFMYFTVIIPEQSKGGPIRVKEGWSGFLYH